MYFPFPIQAIFISPRNKVIFSRRVKWLSGCSDRQIISWPGNVGLKTVYGIKVQSSPYTTGQRFSFPLWILLATLTPSLPEKGCHSGFPRFRMVWRAVDQKCPPWSSRYAIPNIEFCIASSEMNSSHCVASSVTPCSS